MAKTITLSEDKVEQLEKISSTYDRSLTEQIHHWIDGMHSDSAVLFSRKFAITHLSDWIFSLNKEGKIDISKEDLKHIDDVIQMFFTEDIEHFAEGYKQGPYDHEVSE